MVSITLNRARTNMEAAKISTATLARLCDIAPSTLSAAYREQVYLGSEMEAKLLTMSTRLLNLQAAVTPLREPTNVNDLRRMLDHVEANKIEHDKIREVVWSLLGLDAQ